VKCSECSCGLFKGRLLPLSPRADFPFNLTREALSHPKNFCGTPNAIRMYEYVKSRPHTNNNNNNNNNNEQGWEINTICNCIYEK
jgi:hypothetical protein